MAKDIGQKSLTAWYLKILYCESKTCHSIFVHYEWKFFDNRFL